MQARTIEDRLREEYFSLLPDIRHIVLQLEAQIRYYTLPILRSLRSHEQLIVKSRIKDCESAIITLRRKSDGGVFDPSREDHYSLSALSDLAGVRVLAFPAYRVAEADRILRPYFELWESDPVLDDAGRPLAVKYRGLLDGSPRIKAEYQIVPMLLGLFWEVEHSAMYKSGIATTSNRMRLRRAAVERSLSDFEAGVADLLPDNPEFGFDPHPKHTEQEER